MYSILLVEDDRDLSAITHANLAHAGHQVDAAFTCAQAETLLAKKQYDMILLDVMLPDRSGSELCRSIRKDCDSPIIFLSCVESSDTIVNALRSGGDDYMVKPVRYPELLARVDAVIRRSHQKKRASQRVFQSFTMDIPHRRILRDGQEVDLSSIEFALLQYMTSHPDTLLLYQDLYQNVWATDSLGDFRTVMVHISNLRKKIDPNRRGIIETVRGAGYIFSDV
ncbi:MAG: response regulator transcription factor [Oscillibacter sp.]|nr:response regulator transcription factor [Oscillibacter sp.]MCI9376685.1 response regulator transcription factor [Oscillibacter sp.]